MTILIFFILGLMIGSFLNALVYCLRVAGDVSGFDKKCLVSGIFSKKG